MYSSSLIDFHNGFDAKVISKHSTLSSESRNSIDLLPLLSFLNPINLTLSFIAQLHCQRRFIGKVQDKNFLRGKASVKGEKFLKNGENDRERGMTSG